MPLFPFSISSLLLPSQLDNYHNLPMSVLASWFTLHKFMLQWTVKKEILKYNFLLNCSLYQNLTLIPQVLHYFSLSILLPQDNSLNLSFTTLTHIYWTLVKISKSLHQPCSLQSPLHAQPGYLASLHIVFCMCFSL